MVRAPACRALRVARRFARIQSDAQNGTKSAIYHGSAQQAARNEAVQAMAARAVGGPQWKDDRLAEDCESCGIEFNILVSPPATEIAKLRVPRKALLSGSASSAPSNSSRLAWPAIPQRLRGVRYIAY